MTEPSEIDLLSLDDLKEFLTESLNNLNKRLDKLEENKKSKPAELSVWNRVKMAFTYCLTTSSAHGLPHLLNPERIIWIPLMLMSLGFCMFLIIQSIDKYNQNIYITMTEIKHELNLTLPMLKICRGDTNSTFKIKDMLVDCTHGSLKKNCSTLEFISEDCARLNFDSNQILLTQDEEKYSAGYQLSLYIPKDVQYAVSDNKNFVEEIDLMNGKLLVPSGLVEIKLKKTVQEALGQPYTSCNNSLKTYIGPDNISYNYRKVNCISQCVKNAKDTEKSCKEICQLECYYTDYDLSQSSFEIEINQDILVKFRNKLNDRIAELDDTELKKRILLVNIFFERLEYTKMTQSPSMTLTDLIASVGGLMGLFIGVSFLSVAELFDLAMKLIMIWLDGKKSKKTKNSK